VSSFFRAENAKEAEDAEVVEGILVSVQGEGER